MSKKIFANEKVCSYTQPWWYYAVHDPYERVNIWSHGIPGLLFLILGLFVLMGFLQQTASFSFFCFCAATTHILSTVTHLFPKNERLRKLDHIGIVALIVGTPVSALWELAPHVNYNPLWCICGSAFGFAFLPRVIRTICFMLCGISLGLIYGPSIINLNLCIQGLMYFLGGTCFIRNGGHSRPYGFTDHHFLHYFVIAACSLHCWLLIA